MDVQRQRLVRFQHLAQREIEAGWQPLAVKFYDFLNALASLQCANNLDLMVWSLKWYVLSAGQLSCGCISCSWYVWEVGRQRLDDWREVVLTAIPKKSEKVGFRSMRYISLLLVIQKFYIRALQSAVGRERKPHETNILGYEPGRSTAGVTATLRELSKAVEWGVGAFVASADVDALFGANPVISRVELVCLVLRCRLPFCVLVVLVRVVWKALTCGTRYWTTHSANLQSIR